MSKASATVFEAGLHKSRTKSRKVRRALSRPIHPALFIGTTPQGMSFEIPKRKVRDFLYTLAEIVRPKRVHFYFSSNGKERHISCLPDELDQKLNTIGLLIYDPSLFVEFGGYTLYSGGEGCFSLRGFMRGDQKRRIALKLLKRFGIDSMIRGTEFEITMDIEDGELSA